MNDIEIDNEYMVYDGPVVLRKSELNDWYCVEKHEDHHDHETGLVKTDYGYSWYCSERIADADVEGSSGEMVQMAMAVLAGEECEEARRCAVQVDAEKDRVYFWSPRNSMKKGSVKRDEAEAWAREVLKQFPI